MFCSKAEMARLRLQAGCCVLKMAQDPCFAELVTNEHFQATALLLNVSAIAYYSTSSYVHYWKNNQYHALVESCQTYSNIDLNFLYFSGPLLPGSCQIFSEVTQRPPLSPPSSQIHERLCSGSKWSSQGTKKRSQAKLGLKHQQEKRVSSTTSQQQRYIDC